MDLISVGLLRRGGGARHQEGGDELKWEKNRWRKNSLSKTFFQEYFNLQLPKQVCLIFHPNVIGKKHKTIIKNIETLRKKYTKTVTLRKWHAIFVSGFFLPTCLSPWGLTMTCSLSASSSWTRSSTWQHSVFDYDGCTEKPDTVRYSDTVRYKTDSRGCLNTLAREVSYTKAHKEGGISLAGVLKHPGERGFLYLLREVSPLFFINLSRWSV